MASSEQMCRICKVVQANYSCSCTASPTVICEACLYAHRLTKGQHKLTALPRHRVEAAPVLCGVCHNSTPEWVCICNPSGQGFCSEGCKSVHESTFPKAKHSFLPISSRSRLSDREFMDRLSKKQKAYGAGKRNLRKNLRLVDVCKEKIVKKVENALKKIADYKEKSLQELDSYRVQLETLIFEVESEIELHMHEHEYVPTKPLVAATLFNDQPPLTLFSFWHENSVYRMAYSARLEPDSSTLPVRWPIWAARLPRNGDSSESSGDEQGPRRSDRYRIKPIPEVRPPLSYQPPSGQPYFQPIPYASQRFEEPTNPYIPDNLPRPAVNPSSVIFVDKVLVHIHPAVPSIQPASFPPVPSSLTYFSLTNDSVSRTALLSVADKISTYSSVVLTEDGKLFACGSNDPVSAQTHLIDPGSGFVTPLADMKSKRFAHGIVLFKSEIFVFGGKDTTKAIPYCEKYASGAWEELATMATARHLFNPCLRGEKVYIFGGEATTACEQYSISANSFDILSVSLPAPGQTAAVLLNDSEILIVQQRQTMRWTVGAPEMSARAEQADIETCWGNMNPVAYQDRVIISMFYAGRLLQVAV